MKYIYLLLVLTTAALTGFIVSVNSIEYQTDSFGSTLTTINATDLIKDSRAVINTNFSTLNTDKMEKSDWYSTTTAPQITTLANLSTVGTITSGIWHGSTVTVPYGGTGSTTLSVGQLLAGNGTGNILTVGNGTAGQLLTASTTGNIPYWSSPSVDTSINYNWTGLHNFASSTYFTANSFGAFNIYGNGYDGDSTAAVGTTTLSRDMYFTNLTVPNGATINPNGFRIFVSGTLTMTGNGKIASNGNAGGNGGNGGLHESCGVGPTSAAGTAGAIAYSAGTLPIPLPGLIGGGGVNSYKVGTAGIKGVAQSKTLTTTSSSDSGKGGNGQRPGYPDVLGGNIGSSTDPTGTMYSPPYDYFSAYNLFDFSASTSIQKYEVCPSSGSGSSGGGGTNAGVSECYGSGAGGGSGSSGGVVWVAARTMINPVFNAIGGNGGNGGNGYNSSAGVGGGGAGGNGGAIIYIYTTLSGSVTTDISGGIGGSAGASGNTTGATNGSNGKVGKVYYINI